MTKSYAQLKATIAKLEKEAAALRAAETTKLVAQIKESITAFGLTVEQLFGRGAKALKAAAGKAVSGGKVVRKGAGVPKYRDPKTGKTWTGFGKAPAWIATARNRDKFLIEQSAVVAAPSAKDAAAPVTKKAARKTGAVAATAKKTKRRNVVAAVASVAAAEVKAERPTAKKAAAKKRAPSKKAAPAKKVAAAQKAPKDAAKPASKSVKQRPAAKTRSPRSAAKAMAPVVIAGAPEGTATGESAS